MKKITLLLITLLTGFCNTTQAALADNPLDILIKMADVEFTAIDHSLVSDNNFPPGPSPGDTFALTGFGKLNGLINNFELSYSYSIAGTFTDFDFTNGKLSFNHGLEQPGVSNQLEIYWDDKTRIDENDAASFTDGLKIATMEVMPIPGETGFFTPQSGTGEDTITFKLIDSDKERYGITNNDLLLQINSMIALVDENGQAFDFGAFDNCGPVNNQLDSCARETGIAKVRLAHTPIPPSLGFFAFSLAFLGWKRKRNR